MWTAVTAIHRHTIQFIDWRTTLVVISLRRDYIIEILEETSATSLNMIHRRYLYIYFILFDYSKTTFIQ